MLQIARKFGGSALDTYWVIMLTISYGNNYVLNEHGDLRRYIGLVCNTIQDNYIVTGRTGGGRHDDHLKCSQWLQGSDYISVSVTVK